MKFVELRYGADKDLSEIDPNKVYYISDESMGEINRHRFYCGFPYLSKYTEIKIIDGGFAIPAYVLFEDIPYVTSFEIKEIGSKSDSARICVINGPCIRCGFHDPALTKCICLNECEYCYDSPECNCEQRAIESDELGKRVFYIYCRMIGCGGTTVVFKAVPEGIKAVWTNENCPYLGNDITIDEEDSSASDGHNVSIIDYDEFQKLIDYAKSKGWK